MQNPQGQNWHAGTSAVDSSCLPFALVFRPHREEYISPRPERIEAPWNPYLWLRNLPFGLHYVPI